MFIISSSTIWLERCRPSTTKRRRAANVKLFTVSALMMVLATAVCYHSIVSRTKKTYANHAIFQHLSSSLHRLLVNFVPSQGGETDPMRESLAVLKNFASAITYGLQTSIGDGFMVNSQKFGTPILLLLNIASPSRSIECTWFRTVRMDLSSGLLLVPSQFRYVNAFKPRWKVGISLIDD